MNYAKYTKKYVLAIEPEKYESIRKYCEKREIQISEWIRLAIDKELSFQTAKESK